MGDFMDAKPVGVFAGHRDGITYIDSRGDDRYVLTNSKDQTLKVWDLRHFSSDVGIVGVPSFLRAKPFRMRQRKR